MASLALWSHSLIVGPHLPSCSSHNWIQGPQIKDLPCKPFLALKLWIFHKLPQSFTKSSNVELQQQVSQWFRKKDDWATALLCHLKNRSLNLNHWHDHHLFMWSSFKEQTWSNSWLWGNYISVESYTVHTIHRALLSLNSCSDGSTILKTLKRDFVEATAPFSKHYYSLYRLDFEAEKQWRPSSLKQQKTWPNLCLECTTSDHRWSSSDGMFHHTKYPVCRKQACCLEGIVLLYEEAHHHVILL